MLQLCLGNSGFSFLQGVKKNFPTSLKMPGTSKNDASKVKTLKHLIKIGPNAGQFFLILLITPISILESQIENAPKPNFPPLLP